MPTSSTPQQQSIPRKQALTISLSTLLLCAAQTVRVWSEQGRSIDHPQSELFSHVLTVSGSAILIATIGLLYSAARITQSRLWLISAAAVALNYALALSSRWGVDYHAVALCEIHLYVSLCLAIWRAPLSLTLKRMGSLLATLQIAKVTLMYLDAMLASGLSELIFHLHSYGELIFVLVLMMLSGSWLGLRSSDPTPFRSIPRPYATLGASLIILALFADPSLQGDLVKISQIALTPIGALLIVVSWMRMPHSRARSFYLIGALFMGITLAMLIFELPFKHWVWAFGLGCLGAGALWDWIRTSRGLDLAITLGYLTLNVITFMQWDGLQESSHIFQKALGRESALLAGFIAMLYLVQSMIPERVSPDTEGAIEGAIEGATEGAERSADADVDQGSTSVAHHPRWDRVISISGPLSLLVIVFALVTSYLDHADRLATREAFRAESVKAQRQHAKALKSIQAETDVEWIYILGGPVTDQMSASWDPPNAPAVKNPEIKPFLISKSEITVGQYRRCVKAQACAEPTGKLLQEHCNWSSKPDNYPMNCASVHMAQRYARWVGGSLPTHVEWLYMAHNRQLNDRKPWGHEVMSCRYAVLSSQHGKRSGCGQQGTGPVCSRPEGHSIDGVCDLMGSVSEWVTYPFNPEERYASTSGDTSGAPPRGAWNERHVGGGWLSDLSDMFNEARSGLAESRVESTNHNQPYNIGFRVRRPAPQTAP